MPQDCCHDQKKQRQRHPPPPFPPRPARIMIHRHKIPGRPPCSRPLTLQIPQTTRIFFMSTVANFIPLPFSSAFSSNPRSHPPATISRRQTSFSKPHPTRLHRCHFHRRCKSSAGDRPPHIPVSSPKPLDRRSPRANNAVPAR